MGNNQPWLDNLSDDWVLSPGTPSTPLPARSILTSQSRRSSVHSSPSRIPVPARRSVEQPSPVDPSKKVPRPCHFVKKEVPKKVQRTPIKPRTPKTPVKCDTHAHGLEKSKQQQTPHKKHVPHSKHPPNSRQTPKLNQTSKPNQTPKSKQKPKPIPKPNLGVARKPQPAMDTRSPLRSVSNISSQSDQQNSSTVQIKPKKDKRTDTTPEWRRRLIHGEIPGDQRDLFAPIGLESVFKPPSPGSETAQHETIPVLKHAGNLWVLPDCDAEQARDASPPQPEKKQGFQAGERSAESPPVSPGNGMETRQEGGNTSRHMNGNDGNSLQTDTHLRSASGLEDLRNEGITPIFISVGSASRPESRSSDSVLLHSQTEERPDDFLHEDSLLDMTSHSLPRDLSMGTLDFVNFRRGQYLGDSSFRKHQLTPSSFPSQRLSPSALANSRVRSSPPFYHRSQPLGDAPTLPRPSSSQARVSESGSPESKTAAMQPFGSPLKLFGNHDTFTNNKLLRRMSQFEESLSEEDEPVSPSEEVRSRGENREFLNARHGHLSNHSLRRSERPRSRNAITPRVSRFGDGQLDNYDFSDTSPFEPKMLNYEYEESDLHVQSRQRSSAVRRHRRQDSSQDYTRDSKTPSSNSSRKRQSRIRKSARNGARRNQYPTIEEYQDNSDGKRIQNSPTKDPNPKRRRTLPGPESLDEDHRDIAVLHDNANGDMSLLQQSLMHYGVINEKDEFFSRSQSTHRPRTPTPSQARSSGNESSLSRDGSIRDLNEVVDTGSFSKGLGVPKLKVTGAHEEVRKGSITTQDFLNEATKIMDQIRANGRTAGGLASVEESDMESGNKTESYDEESTQEEFSRPPSRDGVDMRKMREPREPDPRVLSHLMKFQENDDLEFGVSASVTSLHLSRRRDPEASSENSARNLDKDAQDAVEGSGKDPQSRKTSDEQPKHRRSTSDGDQDFHDPTAANSQASAKDLSARSIPTGSSQSSQAKGLLPSDLVSHLIPEQVNGLVYDRSRHQWVKGTAEYLADKPKGEDSEEDPFKDIPDLSVDELQEMMAVQTFCSPVKTRDSVSAEQPKSVDSPPNASVSAGKPESRPQTREGEPSANASTLHSRLTRFTSSVPNTGTRATSWSTEELGTKEHSEDVEHEIQLHEGRISQPPYRERGSTQQPRVVTISFSSPVVSHVAYSVNSGPPTNSGSDLNHPHEIQGREPSLNERSLVRRPVSRIDERNEDDAIDGQSLIVRDNAGPIETTQNEDSLVYLHDAGQGTNYTSYAFDLSTLSDFTVDQVDHPMHREPSYVAQRAHPKSLRQVHGRFALATENLVKHITDVEPHELYWEDLRRLILRDKELNSLYRLSDFCPRLEDLDVSDNDIEHLSGVPSTLRTLKIQRNFLSSRTAWGHLINLQYLDVSGNELEDLHGFHELIHLRELKANNNQIRNIDGVLDLNGLLSLKLSNNSLATVHFEGAELTRLRELNLSHNELTSVTHLDSLPSLETLNLSSNKINRIDASTPLRNLNSLKLSNNCLNTFDISFLPSLTLLYLDQNFLSTVSGLERCDHLEVLSIREQMLEGNEESVSYLDLDIGLVKDIRKVFLSSNRLSPLVLSPSAPLLSLQLLDVASCALDGLPTEFAVNFPNLKVLNLNFNSLAGIEELVGMNCLSRLAAAGNRIARMRKLCQVLSRIGKATKGDACSLQKVDLRGNPLTVGFYPPPVTGSGKNGEEKKKVKPKAERRSRKKKVGADFPTVLADLGLSTDDMNMKHPATWGEEEEDDVVHTEHNVEFNDPYMLPPADPQADKKYLSHLDDSTKLRRRVLELMLYAGSGGSITFLDGLELHPDLGKKGSDMNRAWEKLEELGVLRRRRITEQ